ncbi:MAG: hypothetical protein ACLVJ6_02230 [Merdibacter sp.]
MADIALQCRIFVPLSDGAFRIAPPLAANCRRIAKEYKSGHPPLVSPTILCYYLKTIYPSSHTNWKNTDRPIIHYPYLNEIRSCCQGGASPTTGKNPDSCRPFTGYALS